MVSVMVSRKLPHQTQEPECMRARVSAYMLQCLQLPHISVGLKFEPVNH